MRIRALILGSLVVACAPAGTTTRSPGAVPEPATTSATSGSAQSRAPGPGALSVANADPYPSTYKPWPSRTTVIRNVTILTAAGPRIINGAILLRDGKIAAVGASVDAPADAVVIDGAGKFVTPGIIDAHSHIGAGAAPGGPALGDVNEMTNPVTTQVWVEHSIWPQDPQLPRALAAGVTTAQILPGSANLFGGRTVVIKPVPSTTVQGLKFPGAKYGLKMACGENPKRVYATRGPGTRMGNMAGYRAEWIRAESYRRKWDAWNATRAGDPPVRDLGLETLAEVLRGNILVQNHCYRADEMGLMIDLAKEFGYKIRTFHHAVEAFKVADRLAEENIAAAVWADWGWYKMEAMDATAGNIPLTYRSGARTIIHSDDPSGIQRLTHDAAKGIAAGEEMGISITHDEAIKWMTINAAWALGLDDRIGSLEVGKNADVVLWTGNPFSIYSVAEKVWVDGALLFDALDRKQQWRTDFELGFVSTAAEGSR